LDEADMEVLTQANMEALVLTPPDIAAMLRGAPLGGLLRSGTG
jgi:hypothetical protein